MEKFEAIVSNLKKHSHYSRTEKHTSDTWSALFEEKERRFSVELTAKETNNNPFTASLRIEERFTHTPIACHLQYNFVANRVWKETYSENFNEQKEEWIYDIFKTIKEFIKGEAEEAEKEEEKKIKEFNKDKLIPISVLNQTIWIEKEEKEKTENGLRQTLRLLKANDGEITIDSMYFGYEPSSLHNFQYDFFKIVLKRESEGEVLFLELYLDPRSKKLRKIEISF